MLHAQLLGAVFMNECGITLLTLPNTSMHQAVYLANRAGNAENLAHSKARNNAGQQQQGCVVL